MLDYENEAHSVIPKVSVDGFDEQGFVHLYNQYYRNVFNYVCFRIDNRSDAEDLVSIVFINVLRRYETYDSCKAPLEAWLIGIAKNVVNDYLRSKKRNGYVPLDGLPRVVSVERQPEQAALMNEEYGVLLRAVSKLQERDRRVIAMKFVTELKNSEIAEILGISESNVGVSVHRALKRLKKLVEKEDDGFAKHKST